MDNTCHQYKLKIKHRAYDLDLFKLSDEEASQIGISDLTFSHVPKSYKKEVKDIEKFIRRYEWLGTTTNYITNYFTLTYQGKLVTVVGFGVPSSFSKLCGPNTHELEQCIHRGASCSIAPKNSASYIISKAIKWYLENTEYRLFSGYSTVDGAKELGIIYQSLNAILVSKNAGRRLEYLKPGTESVWLSDRTLRKLNNYRKIAKKLGYEWQTSWNDRWIIKWSKMPREVEIAIREELRNEIQRLEFRKVSPKLKYVIIKGRTKKERNNLFELFKIHNPKLVNEDGSLGLTYPRREPCKNEASASKGVEGERQF